MFRKSEPIFIENSKIPVWLSYFAPINVWAISFGLWVWCRGKLSEETKRHETIHYQQQIELLFVGQWILYVLFWIIGLLRFRDGKKAYYRNPFEIEAYTHDKDENYLAKRSRFSWVKYILSRGED